MGDFEVDTGVEGGAGRYRAVLSPDWEIWGPDGGCLASIALRAAGRAEAVSRVAGGGAVATEGRIQDRGGRLLVSGGAQLFCVATEG